MDKLYIIGMGPGSDDMLTDRGKIILETADRVLNSREISLADLMVSLRDTIKGETALLVSGDSGFYSVTKTILRDFGDIYDIEVIPGIGSIPYFAAKIKTSYDDAVLISLHGTKDNIIPKVAYNNKVFALTGGENTIAAICRKLSSSGLGDVKVSVGERLSFPEERVLISTAAQLEQEEFDSLSVICIENPDAVNPYISLKDSDFTRGDTPMTKEEVRWLSILKLGVAAGDTVFDIGAGTGSVAVEMARKATDGFVFAIEVKEEACDLIRENARKHGAFNLEVIHGEAPEVLANLPAPDKAFIGGSSGNMDGIIEALLKLNPNVKITANAITLQTINEIITCFEKFELVNTDITCVNIAQGRRVGSYDMMMAQNPVYIITGARS
ncbi:MAG: precorrin-6Y C5,15-methyltransferase (decarboxylating) subunit CbiT [Oscillospiraceae bacterium]|nr:precorrin-6Y C5,15-methyltransferase (decarboxylating) subunit CbiT [Oscillospiraceae bacterium]